jgi:hypothetical protein
VGVLAYLAWAVSVVARSTLSSDADLVSTIVYRSGQGAILVAALLAAGGVLGLAVTATSRLVSH